MDQAPAAVHAQLLVEGTYLCSTRTMYRILAAAGETGRLFTMDDVHGPRRGIEDHGETQRASTAL